MGRAGAGAASGPLCRRCAVEPAAGSPSVDDRRDPRSRCARCGNPLENRHPARVGALGLAWRNWILRLIVPLYWAVTLVGAVVMLVCGGFVPVLRAWLRNELDDWSGVVARLGGLWFRVETLDPDSDLGPVLARVNAPSSSPRSTPSADGWASGRPDRSA